MQLLHHYHACWSGSLQISFIRRHKVPVQDQQTQEPTILKGILSEMPPLTSSSLAPVSTGKDLFVYYQVDANIFEASSHDGGASWGTIPDPIVKDARGWGSPFTAYYNKQDADYDDKETVNRNHGPCCGCVVLCW